jgi:hypothetical protein
MFLKQGRIFLLRIKIVVKTVYFHKKRHLAAPLKENEAFFVKKIRGFEIHENMSRAS